jgi:hypothetical protein
VYSAVLAHIFSYTNTNGAAKIIKYRKDRCSKHLAAPTLSGRPVSIHLVGVSRKGNRFYTRWPAKK